jgi:hypothetical protein
MKNLTLFALIALTPLLCRAADELTPLDVKTGLWESTVVSHMSGIPGMSDDMLAKMPPEQRARIEAAIKGASGPRTFKSCVTPESIRKSMAFGDSSNSSCKRTLIHSTATSAEYHIECTGKMNMVGDGHVEVVGQDSVKGETVMKSTVGGGHPSTSNITFTAHWVGSDCGSVKPIQ